MMKFFFGTVFLCLLCTQFAYATHNRAGEITYKQISAYTYEVTIVTYTYTPSAANEYRGQLPVEWGDGTTSFVQRATINYLPDNYTKNTYVATHTFPGPGVYKIVMEDPNRNSGIKNIFDSVNIPFSISTTIKIDPVLGGNSTPILLNPPVDKAALGQRFVHNPAAYDVDGDSLSYSLAVCRGAHGEEIPNYTFPAASNELRVDSVNGDLIWDAPIAVGSYNVAMHIEEWRNGIKIGYVARDIQIEVFETDNRVPVFTPLSDVCVRADDTVRVSVSATDPDGDYMQLTARGGPLEATHNVAQFTNTSGSGSVTTDFVWVPGASEVRKQPYTVVFKATDAGADVSLSALQYLNITVIGHPSKQLSVDYADNTNSVEWTDNDSNNVVMRYDVYRSKKPILYTPSYCEYGMPAELSEDYTFVGSASNGDSSFIDTYDDWGVSPGFTYCYRLFSVYKTDTVSSYISDETCVTVEPVTPVITNVSVENTSCDDGEIMVTWTIPRDIDTLLYPKPYEYSLLRAEGFSTDNFTEILHVTDNTDTVFYDKSVCSKLYPYSYRVDMYSRVADSLVFVSSSPISSSPLLSLGAGDSFLELHVETHVSWENDTVFVYRQDSLGGFDSLGIFQNNVFRDSALVNLQEYCYYVRTSGYFESEQLPKRVYNSSQIMCAQPIDTVPPKPISFSVTQSCENFTHTIEWDSLSTDIVNVRIYYRSCAMDSFNLLEEVPYDARRYVHAFSEQDATMSSCYYVTSVDNVGNESEKNTDTCLYTCPVYILPNIFTPNNDGENEIYVPAQNKYVQKVDMKIYNSWGDLVFETKDPELNWKGLHQRTQKNLPDGVFYYVCDVYEYWQDCTLQPRILSGFIHKFSEGQ
ncbi:MAG: gliding motility-associated C-terminal domain-containing protein [Bacteroidales bacterium]|jgi:gliding motility-associated-like protein|nr:gliding motility-associated C-terminal domain-containing protein [Bacteroidales bacterium]